MLHGDGVEVNVDDHHIIIGVTGEGGLQIWAAIENVIEFYTSAESRCAFREMFG